MEAEEQGAIRLVWAFVDKGTAKNFLYASTIATCGTSFYYQKLHRRFRNMYQARVKQMLQMTHSGTRKDPRIAGRNDDFFVFAWRQSAAVCPGIFLIGKTNPHQRRRF